MAQKSINSSTELANAIKNRRIELNLTIEEAAHKAGVGTKTWSRYETGESIRQDKYKGVCKALNWRKLPLTGDIQENFDLESYKRHEAWSKYLEDTFGDIAAISFVIGSDILLDYINGDLGDLSKQPAGTHIGQLGTSFLEKMLPEQFLMNYDYEFLYALRAELILLREIARSGRKIIAHSVLDELILCIIADESEYLIENEIDLNVNQDWKEWIYDIFGDGDVDILYSTSFIPNDDCYHFSHWFEQQFYCD